MRCWGITPLNPDISQTRAAGRNETIVEHPSSGGTRYITSVSLRYEKTGELSRLEGFVFVKTRSMVGWAVLCTPDVLSRT